jgi:hypothetical protein
MQRLILPWLLLGTLGFANPPAATNDPVLPGNGFEAAHYETLWTKSPFAVATADAAATESADYSLVGVVQLGGISYANLIDKGSQEHFLLASDKPVRGLTLVSVTRGHDPSDTMVVVQRGGESISLKLEDGPPVGAMVVNNMPPPNPYPAPVPNAYQNPQGPGGWNQPGLRMPHRRFPRMIIPPRPPPQQPMQDNQNQPSP